MRRGALLLIVGLVLFGGIIAVLLLQPLLGGNRPSGQVTVEPTIPPSVDVLIALQDIPRGTTLTDDLIGTRQILRDDVDDLGAIRGELRDLVINNIAVSDLRTDQLITRDDVLDAAGYLRGSEASLFIPPGMVAVAVPADRLTTVAYAIQPGDRIDVISTFRIVNVDPEFQTILPNYVPIFNPDGTISGNMAIGTEGEVPGTRFEEDVFNVIPNPFEFGEQRPRQVTQLTLENILVLRYGEWEKSIQPTPTPVTAPVTATVPANRAGQPAVQGNSPTPIPRPDIITLALPRQDALVLIYMLHSGTIMDFALRPAGDLETGLALQPVTLAYTFQRFQIEEPPKLPYTTDPALWSIESVDPQRPAFTTPPPHPNPTPVIER